MFQNTRVKANFGARPFAYAEGQQHREAADEANDLTREIRESFSHLPFNSVSDSEEEGTVSAPSAPSSVIDPMDLSEPLGPPCKTVPIPKPLKGSVLQCHSNSVFRFKKKNVLDVQYCNIHAKICRLCTVHVFIGFMNESYPIQGKAFFSW